MGKTSVLLAMACLASPAIGQDISGWQFNRGQSGQPHELTYRSPGDHHAEIYMFCREGEGFIFIRFSVERHAETETIRAGTASNTVPASYDDDPHFDWDSATVALPSDQLVFRNLSNGANLVVRGRTYALRTPAERRDAANFVRVCQLTDSGL